MAACLIFAINCHYKNRKAIFTMCLSKCSESARDLFLLFQKYEICDVFDIRCLFMYLQIKIPENRRTFLIGEFFPKDPLDPKFVFYKTMTELKKAFQRSFGTKNSLMFQAKIDFIRLPYKIVRQESSKYFFQRFLWKLLFKCFHLKIVKK